MSSERTPGRAVDQLAKCREERDRLRQFAEYVMDDVWNETGGDGAAYQDKAEELGLIEERDVNPDENDFGAERLYFMVWK